MTKATSIALAWLIMSCAVRAQNTTSDLLHLFGDLPRSMNNQDITELKDGDNKISPAHYKMLGVVSDEHEVFPIGKVIVGKMAHIFYADVKYGHTNNPEDYLIDISGLALDVETGKAVPSGVSFYLGMVGKDALTRTTSFKVHGNIITFTITSINEEGKKSVENTSYKMTGKDLEYIYTSL